MGKLIVATESIMASGLSEEGAFNAAQLSDESRKHRLRQESPDLAESLDALEDHNLLRGRLLAFRLDRESLRHRAASFQRLFDSKAQNYDAIGAALLAAADYTDRGYANTPVSCHRRSTQSAGVTCSPGRGGTRDDAPIKPALEVVLAADAAANDNLDSLVARFRALRESAEWF